MDGWLLVAGYWLLVFWLLCVLWVRFAIRSTRNQ